MEDQRRLDVDPKHQITPQEYRFIEELYLKVHDHIPTPSEVISFWKGMNDWEDQFQNDIHHWSEDETSHA